MLLYDYFRSSAAFRVRIALNLKGLAPERRPIHLLKGEQRGAAYLALNPQGFIPMLEVGEHRLFQSLAILEYLDELQPEPPLLPRSREDRAFARGIALAIACDIHPLNNLRVLKYLKGTLGVDDAGRDTWYRHWVREGFEAVEPLLAARAGEGPYCVGDRPTVADICLVPQVANARRYKLDLAPYPRIREIEAALLRLPPFADALPERQPDAE